jgi:hypothetical protein
MSPGVIFLIDQEEHHESENCASEKSHPETSARSLNVPKIFAFTLEAVF